MQNQFEEQRSKFDTYNNKMKIHKNVLYGTGKKFKKLADNNLFEKQEAFYKKCLFYTILNYTVPYYVFLSL